MTHADAPRVTRRDLLRSAAATAAILSIGACSGGSRPSLGSRPATTTTLLPPLTTARRPPSVALIGDSISSLSESALKTALGEAGFDHIEFDAKPGRRIAVGDSPGLAVLDFAIGAGLEPDVWIIQLGSNDIEHYDGVEAYAALIDLVVERLPPPTPLVWVDTYSSWFLPEAEAFNATLREAMARRGDTAVADWYARCVEVGPSTLVPDGLHPVESGFAIFAEVTVAPIALLT